MCGIFAVIGSRQVPQLLIDGLRKLEYRGYDSSGLATIEFSRCLRKSLFIIQTIKKITSNQQE